MKKIILSIVGILTFTSIGICYATVYTYNIYNYTTQELYFTWHTDPDEAVLQTNPGAATTIPASTGSTGPGRTTVTVTPQMCSGSGSTRANQSLSTTSGDYECQTAGFLEFSSKSQNNGDDNCSIDFNYKINFYEPQPNNQHAKTVHCWWSSVTDKEWNIDITSH